MNTSPSRCSVNHLATQTGVVLLLCLLFLTAMTLLGLSASAETIMQDKLANNLQETQRARQSSLAAQTWAERWVLGLGGAAPVACAQPCEGLRIHGAGSLPAHPESEDLSWWFANGQEAGIDPLSGERLAMLSAGSSGPPMWLIEQVHHVAASEAGVTHDQAWYRIIARGSSQSESAVAVVESVVTRPWAVAVEQETMTEQAGSCPGFDSTVPCGHVSWRKLR